MPHPKSGEPRTYMRVPLSFYNQIKKEAEDLGMQIPEYVLGKSLMKATASPEFHTASEDRNPLTNEPRFITVYPEGIMIALDKENHAALKDLRATHQLGETDTEIILALIKEAHERVMQV